MFWLKSRRSLSWSCHGGHDQLAGPDVAEADGVAVVLELEAAGILLPAFLNRELGDDAVVENGDRAWLKDLSVRVLLLPDANDVVGLPLAGTATGIHEGDTLFVKRGSLSVGIGVVLKRIEDLDFGIAADEDSAVSAALAVSFDLCRGAPFDMPLAIAFHLVAGLNGPGSPCHLEVSLFDKPLGSFIAVALPLGKVRAIEEDKGVGRGGAGLGLRGLSRRGDDGRTFVLNLFVAPSAGIGKGNRIFGMERGETDKERGGEEGTVVHRWSGMLESA